MDMIFIRPTKRYTTYPERFYSHAQHNHSDDVHALQKLNVLGLLD